MNPVVMQGEMLAALESEGLQEALQRRWLVPDPSTGFLLVSQDQSKVIEMREVAESCGECPGDKEKKEGEKDEKDEKDKKKTDEWTKPWDANGGDGLLAWDVDGDGKITSGKELMGTVDLDGKNKFSNGYEKLAKYLELFEAPYLARITDDISIQCTFGDRVVPAERLSGGEKVVLGIAFRFAVYELFVSNLGLLILDEPTVYLDSDRIDSVLSLLERVKGYSRSAGLQLIVITHEARLAGVFDQVIEL